MVVVVGRGLYLRPLDKLRISHSHSLPLFIGVVRSLEKRAVGPNNCNAKKKYARLQRVVSSTSHSQNKPQQRLTPQIRIVSNAQRTAAADNCHWLAQKLC